ncbi:hypothetical protein ACE02Y_20165 [Shewanella xiamenensis]|uniref:hypothetical protein n=1 Tax=Shewanella xiamenensis TaxID=332186 RepID=UPI00313E32C6
MITETTLPNVVQLAEKLEASLMAQYGPVVGGGNLHRALGYVSSGAFRQAVYKKTLPIAVFSIENRRGKFALTKDIAFWLATQRMQLQVG